MNGANRSTTAVLTRPAPRPGSAATFLFRTCSFIARPDGVAACRAAIDQLVACIERRERGTRFAGCFRDADVPTRFLIAFVFEDERAQRIHHASLARKRFDRVIRDAAEPGVRQQSWLPEAGI